MIKGGPKIIDDSLVACLDAHDAKSYAGEPANNLNSDTNDYTGTSYSYNGEWTSSPTRLSKSYDSTIKTPIGTGATLIQESGTNGYHHLSRMGGGETGNHTISFYFKPVTSDINNLKIGMLGDSNPIITFDFTQSPATVTQTGSAISGKLALLAPLSNGWYFCAADFNGRSGGWVGAVGFNINAAYTGVLGSKKAYICGLNYNNKAYAVPSFDRSATDGWVDRSSNSNDGTLVNGTDTGVSHYRDGQVIMPVANSYLDFDGSDDHVVVTNGMNSLVGTNATTFAAWVYIDTVTSSFDGIIANKVNGAEGIALLVSNTQKIFFQYDSTSGNYSIDGGSNVPTAEWTYIVGTYDTVAGYKTYMNGELNDSEADAGKSISSSGDMTINIGAQRNSSGNPGSYFPGRIAKVEIYNKALTAAEVLSNYNSVKPRFGL